MKRTLSVFLALALLLCLCPTSLPANAAAYGELTYEIESNWYGDEHYVIITDCSQYAAGHITIPDTIEGYPVTSIGSDAFSDCRSLTGVTIPEGVTSIGYDAFENCSSLTGVAIPDSLTSIGASAFYNCDSLTTITVPENVSNIGTGAFRDCDSLTGIWVAENNPAYASDDYGVLFNKSGVTLVQAPGGISGEYVIPQDVVAVWDYAFAYCHNLTGVTIPQGVTTIAPYTFYSCTSLANITIPDGVDSIGSEAFTYCRSLTSVIIPSTMVSIGYRAFNDCYSLQDVYFIGNAPTFGDYVFAFRHEITNFYYHTGTAGWANLTADDLGTYDDVLKEVPHICPEYTYDNNHTCTTNGTERGVCLTCGELDVRTAEGSASHRMRYTSNNDATCTTDGTKTGVCVHCRATEVVTDVGSATGHSYGSYRSNNDATCTAEGTETATCAICGHQDIRTLEGTALGHSFTNYVSDNNYTCTLDGTETAKCDRCDATHQRIDVGSKAHWYFEGICIYCNKADPDPSSAALTGSLTAGLGDVLLTLTPVGEDTPAATLTTADGSYSLAVAPGEYILTASKEGYVPRSYTLTLAEGQTPLDLKLHKPGDVNGDGRQNVGDVAKIYAHAKKSTLLTDDYAQLCADYNGDGRINVGDTAIVYAIAKKK